MRGPLSKPDVRIVRQVNSKQKNGDVKTRFKSYCAFLQERRQGITCINLKSANALNLRKVILRSMTFILDSYLE